MGIASMSLEECKKKLMSMVSEEDVTELEVPSVYGNDGRIIVYPNEEKQVKELLHFAHQHHLTVIPEGGGSKKGMGGINETADILLSLKKMKGIVDHSAADLIVTVRPGTTLEDIQRQLGEKGQMIPLDPPWPQYSTIGGIVSSNASGPKRMRYGSARDHVIAMRHVYPDGKIIRTGAKVVKNVAGYDMNKLSVGAMGTLSVITEITLKLRPIPPAESLVVIGSKNGIEPLAVLCQLILDSQIEPSSLEILNPILSKKYFFTEDYCLLISFEDVEKSVAYQEKWLKSHLDSDLYFIDLKKTEEARNWWKSFSQLPPISSRPEDDSVIGLKIGTWLADVPQTIVEIHRMVLEKEIEAMVHGSAGTGITQVYIKDSGTEKIFQLLQSWRRLSESKQGYLIVTHAPLSFRKQFETWGRKDFFHTLHLDIKQKIDPRWILNPGRFVGGI
ncbi:FAD-binding oxidoreductase [Microaerobacter geothermalis]|uniref:FAD-binding oxidoreductase n=1 Tax=Microaerobacter geothermalis TaxID=674972 RepID=UPI001F33317C|nr:FAD-binding oxidoreductase [Microaerobacter geothermalis]MCF6092847.1 FAD-binding oxidoreductase [Microaerobacter geothermalis]